MLPHTEWIKWCSSVSQRMRVVHSHPKAVRSLLIIRVSPSFVFREVPALSKEESEFPFTSETFPNGFSHLLPTASSEVKQDSIFDVPFYLIYATICVIYVIGIVCCILFIVVIWQTLSVVMCSWAWLRVFYSFY